MCLGLPAVMGFPDLISLPLLGVVADKMGCGAFGFADVGMVVVGLGLPAWVWGLWAVAADRLVEVVVDRLRLWLWLIYCHGFGWGVKKNI